MNSLLATLRNGWIPSLIVFVVGIFVLSESLPEPTSTRPVSDWQVAGVRLVGSWSPRDAIQAELWMPAPEKDPVEPIPDPDPVMPDPPAPGPTKDLTYEVKKGDRYWTISARVLGAGHRWKEILALNPDIPEKKLRAGKVLRLPPDARIDARKKKDPKRSVTGPSTHKVRKGETLSEIAAHYYQKPDWKRIFRANRKRLRSPDRLPEGVVLTLPAGGRRKPR